MKVSKLFHWLYASVMLLPVFAIAFKGLYVAFNPNSKDSYSQSPTTYINSTPILNSSSLQSNHLYHYDSTIKDYTANSDSFVVSGIDNFYSGQYIGNESALTKIRESNSIRFYQNPYQIAFSQYINGVSQYTQYVNTANYSVQFDFIIESFPLFNNRNYGIYEYQYILNNSLDNVLYYSVEQINSMPLFNWASDSFIVAPYRYIGNLFGLQQDSPIYTLLSYWTNISVIWLVFDLIMYVPLLAHRWLDKGGLE